MRIQYLAWVLPPALSSLQLHALLSMGRTVYVHCTAGINRATLTVVGYLTFVQVRWGPGGLGPAPSLGYFGRQGISLLLAGGTHAKEGRKACVFVASWCMLRWGGCYSGSVFTAPT